MLYALLQLGWKIEAELKIAQDGRAGILSTSLGARVDRAALEQRLTLGLAISPAEVKGLSQERQTGSGCSAP